MERVAQTSGIAPADARWLVSDEGRASVTAAAGHLAGGARLVDVVSALAGRMSHDRRSACVEAAHARLAAGDRFAAAGQLVFTRRGLEQASHPTVSDWRARRFADAGTVIDLCSGEGGDSIALARHAGRAVAVDRDEARLVLARHNATVCGVDLAAVLADARAPGVGHTGAVHADPSRRDARGRARDLGEYHPPVRDLVATLRSADRGALVLSPAVSWDDPDLPSDVELEFVQVGSRLVEAVAWFGSARATGVVASATLLAATGPGEVPRVVARSERRAPPPELPVRSAGRWLLEPEPAAVRARLHTELATPRGAWRIAEHRALLSVSGPRPRSPWWRAWRIEAVLPARPRAIRRWLRDADPRPLSVAVHGLDADLGAFWRGLGRCQRGPQGRRVHLVRLDSGSRAYVCLPAGGDDGLPDQT